MSQDSLLFHLHWIGFIIRSVFCATPEQDFREKNTDHMRSDIVALLRSSDSAYVRQLIGMDPVAMFRWGILRATIRGLAAFNEAGRARAAKTSGASPFSICWQSDLNQRRPFCRNQQVNCKNNTYVVFRHNSQNNYMLVKSIISSTHRLL